MKDFKGKELNVNDIVIYITIHNGNPSLREGRIVEITNNFGGTATIKPITGRTENLRAGSRIFKKL